MQNAECIQVLNAPFTGSNFACGVNCASGMCSNAQLDVRKRAAGAAPAVSSSDWAQLARWLTNSAVWRDTHTV